MVWVRDKGRCAMCGEWVRGHRGLDWSVGHRRPRRSGGDPRPETNGTGNLVLLHGSGTTGCHGGVERNRTASMELGLLLSAMQVPASVPIEHAVHGRVLLDDEGGVTPCASS